MNAVLSLFVVALFGAESPPTPGTPPIQYRVRLLEMEGLKWRESLYTRLQPVARQGTCAIWTADRELAKPLVEAASRVLITPQLMAEPGAVAAYSQRTTRKVASQLTRHADGPVDHAVAVAYTPNHEELGEGCQFTMAGRKLDQGMLVKVVVEDLRVAAVHQVKLTEFVPKQEGQNGRVAMNPQLDVPEVVRATLAGEWLIADDGMLVASLGAHTYDDGHGKAVVRERLLLVEASPVPARTVVSLPESASRVFSFVMPPRPTAIPLPAHAPVPAMPSRSLPMARAADGTPVPLPPLPEAQVPPTSIPGTTEPCATPQTAPQSLDTDGEATAPSPEGKKEQKSIDPESLTASYEPEPRATPAPLVPGSDPWSAIKPYLLRLPIGPGFEIEISAKVTPAKPR